MQEEYTQYLTQNVEKIIWNTYQKVLKNFWRYNMKDKTKKLINKIIASVLAFLMLLGVVVFVFIKV